MRGVFLILAATAALSTPASAEPGGNSSSGLSARDVRIHRGHHDRARFGEFRRDDRDRRFRGDAFLPYRDYQGDTLWGSHRFNDWWHDRPDRAFPRWLANNQKCERMWWSGGGWRC